jgi:hypothetical protein
MSNMLVFIYLTIGPNFWLKFFENICVPQIVYKILCIQEELNKCFFEYCITI